MDATISLGTPRRRRLQHRLAGAALGMIGLAGITLGASAILSPTHHARTPVQPTPAATAASDTNPRHDPLVTRYGKPSPPPKDPLINRYGKP